MKILHLSAASEKSGAGKATLLTHYALKNLGVESKILFQKSLIKEKDIYSYHGINYLNSLNRLLFTTIERLQLMFYPSRKKQFFSPGIIGLKLKKNSLVIWADVIHIHWANHGFIDIKEIASWNRPIVWTLRDMWAFTGGCHYSFDCLKYQDKCGACPVLASHRNTDLSRLVARRKLNYLSDADIQWVAISSWMLNQAKGSYILKDKNISVIYSGVDSNTFKIKNKAQMRNKRGFKLNDKIILVGAGSLRESYKGFEYAVSVLSKSDKDLIILTFGSNTFMKNEIPQRIIHYGYIKDEELNELYSLADLFFGPSVAEAMGKTFLEAQLCGTPVLCFDETGPADIVSHLESGYLARYKDTDDLLHGLQYCLNKTWNQENISQSAQEQFDIDISVAKYKRLYEKSIVDWSNSSS